MGVTLVVVQFVTILPNVLTNKIFCSTAVRVYLGRQTRGKCAFTSEQLANGFLCSPNSLFPSTRRILYRFKNLSPLLCPSLLHTLPVKRLVKLPGVDATRALSAVLLVLPQDDFAPDAAFTMQVVGEASAVPPAV